MPRQSGLTPRDQRFLEQYLIDLNGTRAYRRAFPGCTYHTARNEAAKLLAKPCIVDEVAAARRDSERRTRVTADRALRAAGRMAFADPLELVNPDGSARPLWTIPEELRAAIVGVEVVERVIPGRDDVPPTVERKFKYKLADKGAALDKVFRYLGLAKELPPLDTLLASLPADLASAVRFALASPVPPGRGPADGDGDGRAPGRG